MASDALLYEILINKSKLKPLSSNAEDSVDIPLKAFTLSNNVVVDEAHFNANSHLTTANQIFTQECLASSLVKEHILKFNDFVKAEVPLMIHKFEKTLLGKTE